MAGVLDGVRVIEVSTWAALPGAGAILSDWGADVTKVEDPGTGGDPVRGFNLTPTANGSSLSPTWEQDNRNKKSVTINVRAPEGREALLRLLSDADVFLTSTRPKSLEQMRLSWEHLKEHNPRLVMAHLSGYGPKGPDSERPGYDALCFWARGGIALSLADDDAPPISPRPAFGDHITSVTVAAGVAAALYAREKTGRGQMVQLSLLHAGVWASSGDQVMAAMTNTDVFKMSRRRIGNPLTNTYQTADGWIQLVNLQADRFWEPLCRAVSRTDLIPDERFGSMEKRAEHGVDLVKLFEVEFIKRTTADWVPLLDAEGIRYGKIQTTLESVHDEQSWANGYFEKVEHPDSGSLNLVTSPMQFSENESTIRSTAPMLGQNTEEVLLEAGYSWEDLESLKDKGVIL